MRTSSGNSPAPAAAVAMVSLLVWVGRSASAAPDKVDFDRDIKPILANACLRCHGPEKPRSHFRLDDRSAALKGGSDGVDIIPGNGDGSALIRYVSGKDKDIQMPPAGKGDPLTTNQVSLLKKWIDQGASWSAAQPKPSLKVNAVPGFDWIGVHGDAGKFRELEGVKDGYSAGVDHFSLEEQINPDEKLSVNGRYLSGGQDLQFTVGLKRNDLGFIDAGFDQWRKYYDNIGGFDWAVSPPGFGSAGSLALDEGRVWMNFGLTLPNWPEIVLGFEEQYRVGNESTLAWGDFDGKNIAAATEAVNEHTDIIKLDITDDIAGWHLEEDARLEIYRQMDRDNEPNGGVSPGTSVQVQDNYHQVQGMNTLTVEKTIVDWWSVGGGYYYSRLEGSDSLDQTTSAAGGATPVGYFWQTPQVTVSTESHIFSVSSLFHPIPTLSLSLAAQNEWTHEDGFGTVFLDFGSPPTLPTPMIENADMDTLITMQNATLRYSGIPFTILSADGRFTQEGITEYQQDAGAFADDVFSRTTVAHNDTDDIHVGFDTSPRRWVGLNAQYRYFSSDTDYNQVQDSTPLSGYPAFILGRQIKTDEVNAKLVFKPAAWFRTTLNYQITRTDYSTITDPVSGGVSPGGPLESGVYDAHTYALSTAWAASRRLNISGTFSYSDSRTTTFDNNDPSIVAYRGGVYLSTANVAYILNKSTDVNAAFSFGHADYGQNNSVAGVPLGLDYTRYSATLGLKKRFGKHVSGSVQYSFYRYDEPSAGGLTDYTAQGIFSTLSFQW